jgi:hypothetical protein
MSFREVNDLVTEASRTACSARPRSLTFRPVHDGPAEIAAPLKLVEDSDANPSSSRGVKDVDGDILDCDELPVKDAAGALPPGVEILPNGGFEITESSHSGFVQPMYSTSRVPAPLIRSGQEMCPASTSRTHDPTILSHVLYRFSRLEARHGVRRLPEMWFMTRKGDCGSYLEMEFTQAPMGIVFQVRFPHAFEGFSHACECWWGCLVPRVAL